MRQSSIGEVSQILEDIYYTLFYGLGIAELGIAGVILMISIITAAISLLVAIVVWVLEAIPLYKLAKKNGRKHAWLAWVPLFGNYFRMYVLADIPGDKPFSFGSRSLCSRNMAFWIYVGIEIFGDALINIIVLIINFFFPVVGLLALVLPLLPWICTAIMEYIFLKDVIDMFKTDKKSNNVAAIVITVLDNIVTLGFARLIYLYTLLKYAPIKQNVNNVENNPSM